jgi:hypothetical protein
MARKLALEWRSSDADGVLRHAAQLRDAGKITAAEFASIKQQLRGNKRARGKGGKDIGYMAGGTVRQRLDRPTRRPIRRADGGSLGLGVSFDPYAYAAAQRLGAPGANPLDAIRQRLAAPSATPFNRWATANDPRTATVRRLLAPDAAAPTSN